MTIEAVSGVYVIEHIPTGRLYVGSAVNCRRRWGRHRWLLLRGQHHSRSLQRAWDEDGEAAFRLKLIERVEREEDLIAREQFHIDALFPSFNVAPFAGSRLGTKHSVETRKKIGAARLGWKWSDEHKAHMAAIGRGRKMSPEAVAAMVKGKEKRHRLINPAGELVVVTNLKTWAPANGLSASALFNVLAGKTKAHKGWRAADVQPIEYKALVFRFVSPNGEVVETSNLTRFCKERGLNCGNMHSLASGRVRSVKGWRRAPDEATSNIVDQKMVA